MNKGNQPEGLWTVEKVAEFLEMHPQTVYAKSRLGEIPSLKIGRSLRFRPEDIRAWVATHERGEPAESPCMASHDPIYLAGLKSEQAKREGDR